jgi:hypothetical protein
MRTLCEKLIFRGKHWYMGVTNQRSLCIITSLQEVLCDNRKHEKKEKETERLLLEDKPNYMTKT